MVQASARAALSGPTLVRLLAQLTDADVVEARQSLPDRLSQWLGWTDAIALSTALGGEPPGAPGRGGVARDDTSLCASVRSALTKAIAREGMLAAHPRDARDMRDPRRVPPAAASSEPPDQANYADYRDYRQRYLSLQQTMETEIGQLRARLRTLLAAQSPAFARLAAVDAIMERSLVARERSLLASIPVTLGAYFERLRAAEQDPPDNPDEPSAPRAWLAVFRQTMQSVLLAELEVRFQPVEGLLAALRAR